MRSNKKRYNQEQRRYRRFCRAQKHSDVTLAHIRKSAEHSPERTEALKRFDGATGRVFYQLYKLGAIKNQF